MTPRNAIWLGVGFMAGLAVWFTQVDAPKADTCVTYRVAKKVAVSYALMPPNVAMLCPSPIVQPKIEEAKAEEVKAEEPEAAIAEEKPKRRFRHHRKRWRRY